jgi:hypothetical protein
MPSFSSLDTFVHISFFQSGYVQISFSSSLHVRTKPLCERITANRMSTTLKAYAAQKVITRSRGVSNPPAAPTFPHPNHSKHL